MREAVLSETDAARRRRAGAAGRRGDRRRPVRDRLRRRGRRARSARSRWRRWTCSSPRTSCARTDDVRRFRFRHPIVRRTVYETVGPGRRLAGHARAAAGLERDGAGPVALAHHVEQSAAPRRRRGRRASSPRPRPQVGARAPQTAVHWLTVARSLARGPQEFELLGPLAGALAGRGPLRRRPPGAARAARAAARGRAGADGADRRPAR